MANTEWWQRGPIDGVPADLQPVAHILLQVHESVGEMVAGLTEEEWNRRPAGVAPAAFHVRHMAGVIDRLFTYARGQALSAEQLAAIKSEGSPLAAADVAGVLEALSKRIAAAVGELKTIDVTTLGDFRGVGRAQLPSTVIGCLVHGAEHAMRHVGQLSVTMRVVRSAKESGGPPDEELVRSLDDQERSAALKRDVPALERLWSDQFTVNAPNNQVVVGKRAVLDTFVHSGVIDFASFERQIEFARVDSEFAVLMGLETLLPNRDAPAAALVAGQPVTRRFTNIWRRESGTWRLFWRHANVIAIK